MDVIKHMAKSGVVPVVVIENAEDAVPTAKALLAGGIDVMEITFRTEAAPDAISAVTKECPDMIVGAGTVITLEQCKKAVSLGAKFIVSPGFDSEVVEWCVKNNITVTPGCVTPTEIMAAMKLGIKIVKFFPAGVYGGLQAMKALSAPFGGIKFLPTGGVNGKNCGEFISEDFIHAVGGSWICTKADISAHNFDKITSLCKEARKEMLGFSVDHIGINCDDEEKSMNVCNILNDAFDFSTKLGNSSNFASDSIEVMKSNYLGENGHIAISTRSIEMAINELEAKGYEVNLDTAKYKNGSMKAVYLKNEIGGFAIHLKQA